MNETKLAPDRTEEERQRRIGLWGAGVFAALGFTFLIFWVYNIVLLQQGRLDFSDKVLLPVVLFMAFGSLGALVLIRGYRLVPGLRLLFVAAILPPVMAVFSIANFYTFALAYLAAFAPIVIAWVFPRNTRRGPTIASVLAVLAILGIEAWQPGFRSTSANLRGFAPYAIAAGAVALLAFAVRQALVGNIRTKLIVSFVGIAIAAAAIIAFSAQQSLSKNLTESIGQERASLAQAQGQQIGEKLRSELDLLKALALTQGIRERADTATTADTLSKYEITQLDQNWQAADAADNNADPLVASVLNDSISTELNGFKSQFPENVEVFLTDLPGVSIGSTGRTSDYLQSDEAWWQTAYKDGQYIGQPEFDASTKTLAINMAVAVRAPGSDRVAGILRTTVNINSLANILIAGQAGKTGHTDLYLPDGQIVEVSGTSGGATELAMAQPDLDIGKLATLRGPYSIIPVAGVPSLVSPAPVTTNTADKAGADQIQKLGWQVVAQQQENEALAPVQAQTNSILLLAAIMVLAAVVLGVFLAQLLAGPIVRLNMAAQKVAAGDLSVRAKVETRDETGTLAATFNSMISQLQDVLGSLEQRVAAATRSLTLAAEVGRNVAQLNELDSLLKNAVELIQQQFGLYYAQVYLVDPGRRNLVLRAGTGDVGKNLMARHHSLPVDLASLNGTAAVEGRAVIVENTEKSAIHRPNPMLPDTRSEMVIPLMVRERLVGTLDIQSTQAGALSQENRPAFEALAGQLAVAVDNASLLAETEEARARLEAQSARLVRSNWQQFLNAVDRGERIGYTYDLDKLTPHTDPVATEEKANTLATAIPVLNEPVGVIRLEGDQAWSSEDAELVETVARQLGQQVENLRLVAQADQYRAEAEQALVRLTREGWEEQLGAHPDAPSGFVYDRNVVAPITADPIVTEAADSKQMLEVRGQKIGELAVAGAKESQRAVTEVLTAVGQQLSAHIESLRLFEESERSQIEVEKRARQLAAVADVSTVSAGELNIDKMLHSVVHRTQRQFGLYHAHIFLYDEKSDQLKIAACGWQEGDPHEGTDGTTIISMSEERSLVARSARTRKAVIVNDVHNEPGWLPNPLLPDTAAELAVPLVVGDTVLGVLDVQSEKVNAFTEEDANIQTTLASQVAIALQNARSFAEAQRQAQRETALNAISQQIQSATSVDAVLQIAARELGRALGAPLTIAQLGLQEQKPVPAGVSSNGGNGNNGHHG